MSFVALGMGHQIKRLLSRWDLQLHSQIPTTHFGLTFEVLNTRLLPRPSMVPDGCLLLLIATPLGWMLKSLLLCSICSSIPVAMKSLEPVSDLVLYAHFIDPVPYYLLYLTSLAPSSPCILAKNTAINTGIASLNTNTSLLYLTLLKTQEWPERGKIRNWWRSRV